MKIEKAKRDNTYVVKISGEISFREKSSVRDEFNSIMEEMKKSDIKKILIDGSEIIYIDSLEIGFFVNLKKNMNKEGLEMFFINVSKEVMAVFKLLSLEKILCKVN